MAKVQHKDKNGREIERGDYVKVAARSKDQPGLIGRVREFVPAEGSTVLTRVVYAAIPGGVVAEVRVSEAECELLLNADGTEIEQAANS